MPHLFQGQHLSGPSRCLLGRHDSRIMPARLESEVDDEFLKYIVDPGKIEDEEADPDGCGSAGFGHGPSAASAQ